MVNKISVSIDETISKVFDGATLMIGGFALVGEPTELLHALVRHGAKELILIACNAGGALESLFQAGQVKKLISSYPRSRAGDGKEFAKLYRAGFSRDDSC